MAWHMLTVFFFITFKPGAVIQTSLILTPKTQEQMAVASHVLTVMMKWLMEPLQHQVASRIKRFMVE